MGGSDRCVDRLESGRAAGCTVDERSVGKRMLAGLGICWGGERGGKWYSAGYGSERGWSYERLARINGRACKVDRCAYRL